jgi:hypothetical protein
MLAHLGCPPAARAAVASLTRYDAGTFALAHALYHTKRARRPVGHPSDAATGDGDRKVDAPGNDPRGAASRGGKKVAGAAQVEPYSLTLASREVELERPPATPKTRATRREREPCP